MPSLDAAPAEPAVFRAWPRILPLYGVVFAGFVGYSLMITVFTPLLLRDGAMLPPGTAKADRTIILGVLLSLYPLGQFVGSPFLGTLSDRIGRRPVLLRSLAATTLCYALIATAVAARQLTLLAVVCFVAGLAEANIVTAQSAIADIVPPDQRNRYFGYIYMSVSLAYVVGPLVGGKLADPTWVPWFDEATPFWAVFVLLALVFLALLSQFRETKSVQAGPPTQGRAPLLGVFAGLLGAFTDRKLRHRFGVNFLLYLAIFGFFRSYPMYLVDEFHLGVSRISEFVAWVGLPIVLANIWLTGALSSRFSVKALTMWPALLTGVLMLALAVSHGQWAMWPLLFLTGATLAVCLPSCATLLSNAASEADQGRVMGTNQAIQVAAEALSGLAAGLLAAFLVKLPLLVLGAVSILASILVAWLI